jgi:hypothetical protein
MRWDEYGEGWDGEPLLRIPFPSHGIVLSMESFILQGLSFQSRSLKQLFILIMYLPILNSNINWSSVAVVKNLTALQSSSYRNTPVAVLLERGPPPEGPSVPRVYLFPSQLDVVH